MINKTLLSPHGSGAISGTDDNRPNIIGLRMDVRKISRVLGVLCQKQDKDQTYIYYESQHHTCEQLSSDGKDFRLGAKNQILVSALLPPFDLMV